jgi:CheY-like chemotaxis protein/anti-sigma regulatory factor (Ser/Thr protein kinase)
MCGENVELELDLSAGNWRADMPDADVRLVLRNLVENAVDATTRGVVFVHTRVEAGLVQVRVEDAGDGMSDEVFASAREPFFTTRAGRSGLGLSAVHGLVQAASGTLELNSRPGDGTRVSVSVPGCVTSDRSAGTQRGTVLLAEDDPGLRGAVAMGLRLAGHAVVEAVDGVHALEKFSDDITLLLTDMEMPRMNGDALYEELQKRRPGLPTLFISGHSWSNVPAAPHTRFLSKPTSLASVARTVAELLEQEPGRMA